MFQRNNKKQDSIYVYRNMVSIIEVFLSLSLSLSLSHTHTHTHNDYDVSIKGVYIFINMLLSFAPHPTPPSIYNNMFITPDYNSAGVYISK